jgi:hypothetical protein
METILEKVANSALVLSDDSWWDDEIRHSSEG